MINSDTLIKSVINPEVILKLLKIKELPTFEQPFNLNVQALDVGYGFTKFTTGVDKKGEPIFKSFPSLVPRAPMNDMAGEHFMTRDTIRIEHGGTEWEVGPDCYDIASKNDVRALHDDFINTEQYKVLFKAALAYMDTTEIDLLVLGLPVSYMSKKEEAITFAKGTHAVAGKEIVVKDVIVVPQPLGALYNHAITSDQFERLLQTNSLIIDPGYHTFDFLTTRGLQINPTRSGARPGGMHSILKAIQNSINTKEGVVFDDLNLIDTHLDLANYRPDNTKRSLYIYGKEVPLEDHVKNTGPVISENINYLINTVQDTKDIAQIVVAGGPGKVFEKGLRKAFPHNDIMLIDDGIYTNCRGFFFWGLLTTYAKAIKALKG